MSRGRRRGALPSRPRARTDRTGGLTMALDALPLGVVVAAPDGQITHLNDTARRLTEGGVRTALAWQAVLDLIDEVLADGEPHSQELQVIGPPEQSLVIEASRPPGGSGAVAVIRDITELRQLEVIRRDFVANVSHELRTPIGAIAVLADALANSPGADDSERLARRIRAEADRLTELVSDVLDLSRIEALRPDPAGPPVDLTAVVAQALDRSRPVSESRQVPVHVSTQVESAVVPGDESQLVSAVSNLLENAAKYSDAGQPVELELRDAGPDAISVVVRDRGIGIPSWELDRIFERFYRVDRGRARGTGGTGLGLAIVRHVATNHGGDVRVSSVEGEGSVFTLLLPAEPGPMGLVAEAG
ncbi:MAG: two-component sensor histidine kinase [Actinobacteria bacterium]|nr:two-component sensor histidine kinase [Actinomycetota bacterium]